MSKAGACFPAFKQGNFGVGITRAVDQIIAATKGEYTPAPQSSRGVSVDTVQYFIFVGIWVLMWLASILGRSKSWWAGGVLGSLIGLGIGLVEGFMYVGLSAIVLLVPIGLLFDYFVSRTYERSRVTGVVPWWIGGGQGGGGRFGGFGGFGGGLSGGGGSSGRW